MQLAIIRSAMYQILIVEKARRRRGENFGVFLTKKLTKIPRSTKVTVPLYDGGWGGVCEILAT